MVLERQGFYGSRWVSAIEPNVEAQSRKILRLAPDALQIWKDLALFYVRLLRFDDARRAASEYVARAPHDPEFPAQIASAMMGRDRFAEIAAILKPVVARHERMDLYASYGYAVMSHQNDTGPGIEETQREQMTRRFARLDSRQEGLGLGLAICHKIARAHGATLAFLARDDGARP